MIEPRTRMEQGANEKRKYRQKLVDDTIDSSTWSITPLQEMEDDDETPTLTSPTHVAQTTDVLLSGLTKGKLFLLTVHILGVSAQEYENSMVLLGI